MSFRVLIADRIAGGGLAPLRDEPRIELVESTGLQGEALSRALTDVDAVIVRSTTRITRESLAHAERLKVIGRAGVGVDNIDVEAATERGVAVLNAPAGNTVSAAELTMALLLAVVRRIPGADRSMRQGEWDRSSFSGIELYGKTLGLVGAGRIGGEVARRAQAFGMDVLAYDPFLSEERAAALNLELAALEDVIRRADVLSIHVPLTESTAGLIGAQELASMKPGAILVNAARGGVVDEEALWDALEGGHLGGAALDVFEQEPLPADHPLRSARNVVLTPHLGAATREAQQNVAVEIAAAVRNALIDQDFTSAVNAPALAGEELRRLRPMLDLAERLGALAAGLAAGPVERVEARYAGSEDDALRPITAATLIGVLGAAVGRPAVNWVNAIHLARARSIEVHRIRVSQPDDYGESLEVIVAGGGAETRVAGAVVGRDMLRVVRINDYHIDIVPRGTLLVLRNRDVPGVIGQVGTLLGRSGVNIAEYHQARLTAGGEALAAISIDGHLSAELLRDLRRSPEILEVTQISLD
jgi:D-3-phosphoglycerate dehydrogenase / 2-oxoglutarate reductase